MTEFGYLSPVRLLSGLDRRPRVDFAAHQEVHGPLPAGSLDDLVAAAKKVDLRGRGGAAFPFARKLTSVASAARSRDCSTVVLVNATEGEPASTKDHFLLARTPHLILDGAVLAARALGARQVVVAVTDRGQARRSIRAAVAEGGLADLVRVASVPERFVTGESGALVSCVNGGLPLPPGRKVRTSENGVGGLPTLLSNAETFAQFALLARLGPDRYAAVGTPDEPGTVLLTVWGTDGQPNVVETPTGVPLVQVLNLCDAGVGQGVLIGGYHGMWLAPEAAASARVSRADMEKAGSRLGAGVILPLNPQVCPLGEAALVAAYLGAESSGQCGPCRLGLPAMAQAFGLLASGDRPAEGLEALRRGVQTVPGRGACNHPDGSVGFIESTVTTFAQDVEAHLAHGTCGRPVAGLMPVVRQDAPDAEAEASSVRLEVDWTRCAAHGLCGHLAPGLVQLDENGYPIIADADVPHRLVSEAQEAVEKCPALALRLIETD
ncbi:NADH-ubiquinone oxidoreductase-F iron-sulfur binding region domain-containing protein [Actinomadura sp. DC4]|uniref:NADH-ubiquinone oxidoreductase-F iron-sulfur binding region domain-containing protein n=1 Tax=Actinomadura sp. DC4 TaxID=3055069 RepID=UPI0025AFA34F|nr:NADH-ubiquinone oxidoreductase-F iron-sulfur binding region domain-containing protein [Actinomadura sp. DC4]MDN3358707.1 NADH-ubiquinone oxidoreductase-F iron-sulfur binding region domain-containing protein [Actinomadura sp. DC4]